MVCFTSKPSIFIAVGLFISVVELFVEVLFDDKFELPELFVEELFEEPELLVEGLFEESELLVFTD